MQQVRSRVGLLDGAYSCEVDSLLRYLNANIFDPALSVKTLKARCRLRDNNISCRFKLETGLYLHSYITARRIDAAAILLHESQLSIAETARCVGYRHLQTFYRLFKDHLGCTPAAFRARRAPQLHVAPDDVAAE